MVPAAVQSAERLAEQLLFPTALATDAADQVPRGHLDALADEGLYGLYGPAEAGGLACDQATGLQVVEALAGGCLTTTFVWTQHHSALRAVAASTTPGLRERWLEPMCLGKCRAGIAVAGIRPGAVGVSARAVDGGWRVNGEVPWVTGWGLIDVVRAAARGPDGQIVWALIDAVESPTLTCQRLRLVAVHASVTVNVRFRDHFVPAERVTDIEPYDDWTAHDGRGLRRNGSLALGVAARCCRLLGPGPLDQELAACRHALDHAAGLAAATVPQADAGAGGAHAGADATTDANADAADAGPNAHAGADADARAHGHAKADAGPNAHAGADADARAHAHAKADAGAGGIDPEALAAARAAASELAYRAAAALVVATGSRAVLLDQHPQRLVREAMFLLIFASRPAIRKELLPRFTRPG